MDLKISIPRARRRAWALAAAAVALAAGGIVLLQAPEPAVATPHVVTTPPATIGPTTPTPAGASSRATLRGPRVDGFFAFTEGAMLENGARTLFAELRLTGEQSGTARREPVALAVALDHSGSMAGEKLEQAREAVVRLIDRMHDDDLLSIVIYDDGALVLQSLAPVRTLRATLPAAVRSISLGSGTNIPSGLDLAASTLAAAPAGYVRRLVLVSDGQDLSGQPLESVTQRVAVRANERVTTSSLGIGADYDERFLGSVADAGRGNYAFLASGSQLDPFLRSELEEASATVADEVIATIDLPAGTTLRHAHGAIASIEGARVRLPLGTLFAGERRKVVLELATTAGASGSVVAASVGLDWRTVEDQARHAISGALAGVRAVSSIAEVDASRDVELHADAMSTSIDAQQIAAMSAWHEGRRADALQLTEAHLGALREVQRVAPSPTVAARITALEGDRSTFSASDAQSGEGRAFRLSRGATRRAASEAF